MATSQFPSEHSHSARLALLVLHPHAATSARSRDQGCHSECRLGFRQTLPELKSVTFEGAGLELSLYNAARRPPSTLKHAPFTNAESSLARNAIAAAMSSGLPIS